MKFRRVFRYITESKADEQKLIDFAGEALAKQFFLLKNRLKSPENDLYYWIKQGDPEKLKNALDNLSSTPTRREKEETAREGAELVAENKYYKVYHITTFEASQKYGANTKWCITGKESGWIKGKDPHNKYWKEYTDKGIKFYFFIPKTKDNMKYALALGNSRYEIFDEKDNQVKDIPNAPSIKGVYKSNADLPKIEIEESDIYNATLLSVEEASDLPESVRRCNVWWWLRSPGSDSYDAMSVLADGSIYSSGYGVDLDFGAVRPALTIRGLKSKNLEPYSIVLINGKKFIVIGKDTALYNDAFIFHYFNKTKKQGNDYKTSDIRKFVENDFIDMILH